MLLEDGDGLGLSRAGIGLPVDEHPAAVASPISTATQIVTDFATPVRPSPLRAVNYVACGELRSVRVDHVPHGRRNGAKGGVMGGKPVGGTPTAIESGGQALTRVAVTLEQTSTAIAQTGRQACAAAWDLEVRQPLDRFIALWSQTISDTATQLDASGTLAVNAAADLRAAGGH